VDRLVPWPDRFETGWLQQAQQSLGLLIDRETFMPAETDGVRHQRAEVEASSVSPGLFSVKTFSSQRS